MRTSLIGITISFSLFAFPPQAQTPTFTAASVVNAASMVSGPIAPGMVANITGSNLGDPSFPGNCAHQNPVPDYLRRRLRAGQRRACAVIFDSRQRVTFQVPFNISGSTATIQVTSNLSGSTLSSAVVTVPVAAHRARAFHASGMGTGTWLLFRQQRPDCPDFATRPGGRHRGAVWNRLRSHQPGGRDGRSRTGRRALPRWPP